MRVKTKKAIFFKLLLIVFFSLVFLFPGETFAANISFSQSILPVRFVYMNNDGSIEKIWSNISESDSLYAIKFIDLKSQNEINAGESTFVDYQNAIKKSGMFSGTIFPKMQENYFTQNFTKENNCSLAIDFITSGNRTEEVHTYT